MSQETETILRSVLYNAKTSTSLEAVIIAIEAMCSEETIAYVEKKVREADAIKKKQ
jgi:hypothetical protein